MLVLLMSNRMVHSAEWPCQVILSLLQAATLCSQYTLLPVCSELLLPVVLFLCLHIVHFIKSFLFLSTLSYLFILLLTSALLHYYSFDFRIIALFFFWLPHYCIILLLTSALLHYSSFDFRIIALLFFWLPNYCIILLLTSALLHYSSFDFRIIALSVLLFINTIHWPGDNPCYEGDRCACATLRGEWRPTTSRNAITLNLRSLPTPRLMCSMFSGFL
jgi:hypothetical protein